MPEVLVTRGADGKLEGFGEKGRRAWLKFRTLVSDMEPGELLSFSYHAARSPRHHKFVLAKLNDLLNRQERFDEFDGVGGLLDWLKMGASHVEYVRTVDGLLHACPKSIAWSKIDEQEFIEFSRAVNDFLWTDGAQSFLWPHLADQQRHDCIADWHKSFASEGKPLAPMPESCSEVLG